MTALWLIFALMTGAAVLVVLGALARGRATAAATSEADAAVYRDQLAEIARDEERGLIDGREAGAARAEVGRRLLAAASSGEAASVSSIARRRIAAAAGLVAIPAIALGFYVSLGTPDLPDMPLEARKNERPDGRNLEGLIARVETELAKNPNDGRGWAVVAPIYLKLGRADEAVRAWRNAINLLGSTPDREADLGEALAAAADGVVTGPAREAFERSVAGDEPSVKGSFYLARAAEQDDDMAGAVARLRPLIVKAPDDAPYLETLRGELQRIAAVPSLPMPSESEAATAKTREERIVMIRSMVDRLGERVGEAEGAPDIGEWLRLVNARAILGDTEKAKEALRRAREKFAGDGRASTRLEALALGLGLEGRGA